MVNRVFAFPYFWFWKKKCVIKITGSKKFPEYLAYADFFTCQVGGQTFGSSVQDIKLTRAGLEKLKNARLFYYTDMKVVDKFSKTMPPVRSVRPKPGFGIGNWNQGRILVSVSEPK